MSAIAFDALPFVAAVLVLAVALGVALLWLRRRAAPVEGRGPPWRAGALIGLQIAAGLTLALTLFPPSVALRGGVLVVATEGAPERIPTGPGDVLVALPEVPGVRDAEPAPDLATALAAHPQVARVRVVGAGLSPRDQGPVPLPVDFTPPPVPPGLIELALPRPVVAGETFSVAGRIGSLTSGTLELLDPAEVVVDRTPVAAGRSFTLRDAARAPGLAVFALRLKDATGRVVETVAVPVEARDQPPPRVLVLAGAAGPETKYLRRWAEDAGLDLTVEIDLGGGVQLADAPVVLTAAALSGVDLVVIDDRRWDGLAPGQRSALIDAVEGGLGLLLRPTGPLSAATRRSWAALGVVTSGGDETVPLSLAPPLPDDAPAAEAPGASDGPAFPELARRDLTHEAPDAVSILRDPDGVALASWRARGTGRIGLWTVADSYALVLAGRGDRYGDLWSGLFSALGRPVEDSRPELRGLARVGVRATLCGLEGEPRILGPDERLGTLVVDPAAGPDGCAAWWPLAEGWHVVRDGEGRETPVHAQAADAAPSLRLAGNRAATLALAAADPTFVRAATAPKGPGSPWPWFALLLVCLAALWWLERNARQSVATASISSSTASGSVAQEQTNRTDPSSNR